MENHNEKNGLDKKWDRQTFRHRYFLKEELVDFCRKNGLPTSGGKLEIADRIAHFLETGEVIPVPPKKKGQVPNFEISLDAKIEPHFVCSEKHRIFFKAHIGAAFSFHVAFQKWLKTHPGKTYKEAISAYDQILEDKKKGKTTIDRQFEYNTYIRDFFADNQGKSLKDAIKCWKYKKQIPGLHRYEKSDLIALEGPIPILQHEK